jgi:hypothetical protein
MMLDSMIFLVEGFHGEKIFVKHLFEKYRKKYDSRELIL